VRIYYESPAVVVTDRSITVPGKPAQTFMIDNIGRLYATRIGVRCPRRDRVARLWSATVAAGASTALVVRDLALGQDALVAPAITLLACCLTMIVCAGRKIVFYELWAVLNGSRTRILQMQDPHTFGQVQRAVVRAREASRHRS
jgi:Family of unknown function (DUF6232)